MDNHLKRIQSHLDEIVGACAELSREAKGYDEKIKELKPVADKLSEVVQEVAARKAEYAEIESKIANARIRLNEIKKLVQ